MHRLLRQFGRTLSASPSAILDLAVFGGGSMMLLSVCCPPNVGGWTMFFGLILVICGIGRMLDPQSKLWNGPVSSNTD